MRWIVAIGGLLFASGAVGQNVNSVYNRDTADQFKIKNIEVQSTVIGPIVRTSAVFTYDNPYKKLTEASFWFDVDEMAALSGFAYYYGDEYVPGTLMDKNKAWSIYTAITSRNEDPGIMTQTSPNSYHCQIYPLKVGSDLRVKLYTVSVASPNGAELTLPPVKVGEQAPIHWTVRKAGEKASAAIETSGKIATDLKPLTVVSQKFKDGRTYVTGVISASNQVSNPSAPTFAVLKSAHYVQLPDGGLAFSGWTRGTKKIAVRYQGVRHALVPEKIHKGSESAQLWAQQELASKPMTSKQQLKMSMKYHIPSAATALLAVPKEEMALFKKKEAEYNRKQREEARKQRNWSKSRPQNWNNSGGGDPEIRIAFDGAEKVYAVLPDGKIIPLAYSDGYWGGNFEIPASAREGSYEVKVIAVKKDGSREQKTIQYNVDRTSPQGTVTLKLVDGNVQIDVRAEAALSEVAAYDEAGEKTVLKEVEPGLYRATLEDRPMKLTILLKDKASNKQELKCSWER